MLRVLKERLPLRHRQWARALLDGNPFRIERATEPVPIGELVSPLRYDVLVRARHFDFHEEHRDLYARDFDEYERRARLLPYYVWFTRTSALTARMDDPETIEAGWRKRLHESAALSDSFRRSGFDEAFPIELLAGARVGAAPSGKRAVRRLYAGDGCHRLALLLASGQDTLRPSQYRVKRYRALVPADTSGFLLKATGAGWPQYQSFLALGYPTVRVSLDAGRPRVECDDPRLRAEVEAVVAVDLPHLR